MFEGSFGAHTCLHFSSNSFILLAAFHYESIETHSFIFCFSPFFLRIMFSSREWIKE